MGLDPARVRLPATGPWPTIRDFLIDHLPMVETTRIDEMFRERGFVGEAGPLSPDAPFSPESVVWFHRDLPVEPRVPFDIDIVHRDDRLVIVDKPHFLATMPRGRHIVETALVRLRRDLNLPELSPAHRLDRVTAGLLMFVIHRQDRGAYQTLFRDRRVHKEYQAIARHDPTLSLPRTVESHIVKERRVLTAYEIDAAPNARTHVELLEHRAGLGRYRLTPTTGRTHQLRLHMCGLGVPILGDPFYPVLRDVPLDDYRDPLQLLARTLAFTDPISGLDRHFTSARVLDLPNSP